MRPLRFGGRNVRFHLERLKEALAGFRDCHVEPDFVLVYRIVRDQLQLVCVPLGTHADLFGK
ncbi:MAG: type II toxin-antitoxin system mRNA interferase toxin, RelE/StbE family [Kiritimatiellae bacterium]|nr:type II toxin-antitoxin system mRNA interferase toxin, RelE/StbE family [Kiritimatiellia bacterium]